MSSEICVVPFWGQGHIFPCMELCHHLASRNMSITLIVPSNIATSLPSSLHQNPLLRIAQFTSPPHNDLALELEHILSHNATRPVCAIVDIMMAWSVHVFTKFRIPTVAFFTSAACSAAMELATWKAHPLNLKPGETRLLPGLPENMAITHSDLNQRPPDPPPHHGGGTEFPPPPPGRGPPHHGGGIGFPPPPPRRATPKLGDPPPWAEDVRETIALMINTCDDLERPFINYIANHIKKPVWGVGPLLPEQYWKVPGSVLHDREIRSNRKSSVTEEEVMEWLDEKPRGSVVYVSFGTEVGPRPEEQEELGQALELCEYPYIWVVRISDEEEEEEGYFGEKGLIIRGWAPQLLILSHPSTGGFLCHCGWNSTVEGVGRGVPLLAWPIRGDQHHDAKLVVSYLKVGYMVSEDLSEKLTRDDIVKGINKLMADEEMKKTAQILSANFQHGFPSTSIQALNDFKDYISATDLSS